MQVIILASSLAQLVLKMDIFKVVPIRDLTMVKITNIYRILNIVRIGTYDQKEIPKTVYFTMLISSLRFIHNKDKKTNSTEIQISLHMKMNFGFSWFSKYGSPILNKTS